MKHMNLSGMRLKGSVLVFSILILSIMLVTSLTILSSALLDRKASLSTGSSTKSFQVADSGVEEVLYQVYKNAAAHNDLTELAAALGGSCDSMTGKVSFSVAGGQAKVSFYEDATTLYSGGCSGTDWRDNIVMIKVEGTAGLTTRAVEVAVKPAGPICSGSPTTVSFTGYTSYDPKYVAFDPHTNSIWVTATNGGNNGIVLQVDPVDMSVVHKYDVGIHPLGITYVDDGTSKSMWVANHYADGGKHWMSKIDVESGTVDVHFAEISAAGGPHQVAFDSDTNSVWTPSYDTTVGFFSKINSGTGSVTSYNAGGPGLQGIAYDPKTNSVWVTRWNGYMSAYDATTGALRSGSGSFVCGSYATGNVYDPGTESIWVSCYSNTTIKKVNVSTYAVTSVSLGAFVPWSLAYDDISATPSIWASGTTGTVSQVSAAGATLTKTVPTGSSGGIGVAIDPYTESLWSVNTADDSITKICLNP